MLGQDISNVSSLHTAVSLGNPITRKKHINVILATMCSDFQHSGWEYLRNLWKKSSHLPLPTFDIWSSVISDTRVLAALVLQMDEKLISELSNELPVLWELIPLSDWLCVINQYVTFLNQNFDDVEVEQALLKNRISKIECLSDSMGIVARMIKSAVLSISDQELELMKTEFAESIIKNGINEAYQELCRCRADSQWPEMLFHEFKSQWEQIDKYSQNLLHPLDQLAHHMSVSVLPILLASFCLKSPPNNWVGDPVHIFKLKQLKAFDEQWFNTVFKFVLAYQSQKKNFAKEMITSG